jgi:NAD(P)-dependent dehydrogenase (short-subunit alcohol dehydrogenase family)
MSYEIEGKTALVTGASRGLGEQISLELIKKGAFVIGTSRSGPPKSLVPFIKQAKADYITGDLVADHERVLKEAYEKYGGFQIFVNNAGALSVDYFPLVEKQKIIQEVNLNLIVPMLIHHDWLNHYRLDKGTKVPELSLNICSISSFYAWPGGAEYQASKTGLMAFTCALRAMQKNLGTVTDPEVFARIGALKDLQIRFLNIYPDSIDTGMISKAEKDSLYKVKGDLLSQDLVVQTIIKAIQGEGKFGRYNDFAILANPKGVDLAFIPLDPETQRPDFTKRILEKIAGEDSLKRGRN